MTESHRFVRLRCPICNMTSPVCDQSGDVRRELLRKWWDKHAATHRPTPIIEAAAPPTTRICEHCQAGRHRLCEGCDCREAMTDATRGI